LEAQVTQRHESIETQRALVAQRRSEIEILRQRDRQLRNELEANSVHEIEIEIRALEQENAQLLSSLKSLEERKQNQLTVRDAKKAQQTSLRQQKNELSEIIRKTKTDYEVLKNETELLKQNIVDLEDDVKDLDRQHEETKGIVEVRHEFKI